MRLLSHLPPGTIPEPLLDAVHDYLIEEIRDYARGRRHDVERGAETPELAALLISKYGQGMAKALEVLGLDVPVLQETGQRARELDPQFLEHQNERWAARPAGLSKGQPTA